MECRQSSSLENKTRALLWLNTSCAKVSGNKLSKYDTVHLGKQATHHTHSLAYHRLVLHCTTCGSYATHKHLINLAQQCKPPTAHGLNCLHAFRTDKFPPGMYSWPMGGAGIVRVGPTRRPTRKSITVSTPRIPYRKPESRESVGPPLGAPPPSTPKPQPPTLQHNMRELLELVDSGERVSWPLGLDTDTARAYVSDYEYAISVAHLYTHTPISDPTPIGIDSQGSGVPVPRTLGTDEPPEEPGPLPLVSGATPYRTAQRPAIRIAPRGKCISLKRYKDRKTLGEDK